MLPIPSTLRKAATLLFGLILSGLSYAQAPPAIQFFMPDGSLPPRELRFTLTSDGGRVDTFFTDSKGKFLITRSQGLKPDSAYTITVESDERTFATTVESFKLYTISQVNIFLRPFDPKTVQPAGLIDLAELDALAPQDARDAYEEGMRALKAGSTEQAVSHLRRVLEIYPKHFRARNDLGVIYMQSNRLDEAAQTLEQAIEVAPRVHYPKLNLAIVRTRQGRYKEAIGILDKLHKENPNITEIGVALADALMAVNRLDEAETLLRAALAVDKLGRESQADANYKLGLLLNRKQRFADAIKELSKAEKVLPNSPRIHLQLGGALLQMNRLDEAERQLLMAYQLGGNEMGAAQFWLGELYFKQKKFASAMQAFERYLIDVPQAPNAAQVQSVVSRIKAALNQN